VWRIVWRRRDDRDRQTKRRQRLTYECTNIHSTRQCCPSASPSGRDVRCTTRSCSRSPRPSSRAVAAWRSVPSVRTLSQELKINPNTAQKSSRRWSSGGCSRRAQASDDGGSLASRSGAGRRALLADHIDRLVVEASASASICPICSTPYERNDVVSRPGSLQESRSARQTAGRQDRECRKYRKYLSEEQRRQPRGPQHGSRVGMRSDAGIM